MKATDAFKQQIQTYIESWAMEQEANLEAYTSEGKKMDDCVTYILNQVKKSGVHGFADKDIYAMAVEYYTTPDIKVGGKVPSGQVVVNHTIELTDAEKETAKQKAKDEIIAEEKRKARGKTTPKPKAKKKEKTPAQKEKAKKDGIVKAAQTRADKKEKAANPTLF